MKKTAILIVTLLVLSSASLSQNAFSRNHKTRNNRNAVVISTKYFSLALPAVSAGRSRQTMVWVPGKWELDARRHRYVWVEGHYIAVAAPVRHNLKHNKRYTRKSNLYPINCFYR